MTTSISFNEEELYWIERTADIESSIAMQRFTTLIQTNLEELNEREKEMLKKMGSELIDLYIFLKELRIKLELRKK